jgi:putative salt-induced outer membrane protein YdiY
MIRRLLSFVPAAALFAATHPAAADTVYLKGGDRLTGTMVTKDGDVLVLDTSYAGKIPIKWDAVTGIETDKPAKFMLKDRTVLQASAVQGGNSTVVLKAGTTITTTPIALTEVAYINPPPEVTGEGVSTAGRANLGITSNRGNTDNDGLFYDAETVIRSMANRFTIGALGARKAENGKETERNNRAWFKYDHFLTKQWYAYANTDFEEDKFKDLNLRSTIGVGSGYQFFDTKELSLALEGGLSYVDSDYKEPEPDPVTGILPDDADEGYAAGRWGIRYAQILFGKTEFFHVDEGLVSVEDPGDLIIRAQTGLRFPLIPNLNATLQYNIDWQNNAPEDTESTDSSYIVSVGYIW